MRFLLINGPNLNLLGTREPEIYGQSSLELIESDLRSLATAEGVELECFQSNFEGALVDRIHQAINNVDAILVNAGAYTHTSVALRDALLGAQIPYVELHLSNIFAREKFRHHSYLSDRAIGVVCGFGIESYSLAFQGALAHMKKQAHG